MAKGQKKTELQSAQPMRAPSPFEEMDRLFSQFTRSNWMHPWRLEWPNMSDLSLPAMKFPKVDVIDHEAEVVVKAEVPGVEKKDLDISVGEDTLTIKGETRHEEKEEKGDYYRSEITRGSFSRTVALPATVNGAAAKATMNNGVLEITLPKVEKAKRHSVPVN